MTDTRRTPRGKSFRPRAMCRAEPKIQTATAAMGTEMYFDTPKSCIDAATPANSAATFPMSTINPATITKMWDEIRILLRGSGRIALCR